LGHLLDSLLALLLVWPKVLARAMGWVLTPALEALRSVCGRAARVHHALLKAALRHCALVLLATAVLIAGGAWLARQLPWELMPPLEAGRFEVVADVPPGTPYARLRQVVRALDRAARDRTGEAGDGAGLGVDAGDVELHTFASLGADTGALRSASGAGSLSPTRARLTVVATNVGPAGRRALRAAAGRVRRAGESLADVAVAVAVRASPAERLLRSGETGLTVMLHGAGLDDLYATADEVATALQGRPGLVDIVAGNRRGNPEIRLRVDRDVAARYGVAVSEVARALQSALQGTIPTQFVEFDRRIDIRVLSLRDATGLDRLLDQPYRTRTGPVPFRELVTAARATGPREIARRDRSREVVVSASLEGISLSEAMAEAQVALATVTVPIGVRTGIGGERAEVARSFASLRRALLLASALVLMVMAAQFESIVTPFVILLTLPLGWVGVVAGLWLTGLTVNVVALIGAVVLTGIVVNDGIVKVDTMNRLRAGGMAPLAAVLEGSRLRLRPVLMTTLTTVCALLPLAFGVGAGAELQRPLAVAVIGGEALGTLLTLIVVPVAYLALARWTTPRSQ
jgi:HAE1 family hydrophobic/amphiphilic exporter-1